MRDGASRGSWALCLEAIEMERNCARHLSLHLFTRVTGGNATRKVRGVRREAGLGLLDDDQILHGFNPACLRILFKRPRRYVVSGLARHGDESRLGRVLELSMRSTIPLGFGLLTMIRAAVAHFSAADGSVIPVGSLWAPSDGARGCHGYRHAD